MRIEIGKKYQIRSGENVDLIRMAFNNFFGVINCGDKEGFFTEWGPDGKVLRSELKAFSDYDLGLIEAEKEDWEILCEHFERGGGRAYVFIGKKLDVFSVDHAKSHNKKNESNSIIIYHDSKWRKVEKIKIKIAALEDLKDFIVNRGNNETKG